MAAEIPLRYHVRVFVLTFLAYACFHMSRKPPGIVKSILHPQSPIGQSTYNPIKKPGWYPFNEDVLPLDVGKVGFSIDGADGAGDRQFANFHPDSSQYGCTEYRNERIWSGAWRRYYALQLLSCSIMHTLARPR